MTEEAGAIVHYGFEVRGFEFLVARAEVSNTGSWQVMEKLGMSQERIDT
jgi:RimJ/RimL family protein N-acetyltransferase